MTLTKYVERFTADVLADALRHADARYWRRRAHDFEAALPRNGDFLGASGVEGAARIDGRLRARAAACRARAALLSDDGEKKIS